MSLANVFLVKGIVSGRKVSEAKCSCVLIKSDCCCNCDKYETYELVNG